MSEIEQRFRNKDFEKISPLIDRNKELKESGFKQAISFAKSMLDVRANETNPLKMHLVFDKKFETIEMLCDLNPPPDTIYEYRIPIDQMIFKKIQTKNLQPVTLG